MTFKAKLCIQGVGSYVPHLNGDQMLVLFPDQAHNDVTTLPRPSGEEICAHYAVVQMDARILEPASPKLLLSLDVQKHWIRFEVSGSPLQMTNVGTALGRFLPAMGKCLARLYRGFRVTTIPINELRTDFRMTYAVCGLR
jgi:hypothetical protein